MAEYRVTPEMLRTTASKINDLVNTKMTQVMNDVMKEMKRLNGSWKSAAADSFMDAFTKLKSTFDSNFIPVADSYSKFLNSTAQAYADADTSINTAVGSIFT